MALGGHPRLRGTLFGPNRPIGYEITGKTLNSELSCQLLGYEINGKKANSELNNELIMELKVMMRSS